MDKKICRQTFRFEGKRHDVTAKSESELITKIALLRRDLEEGKMTVSGNTKVSVWVKKWLETYKQGSVGVGWYKEIEKITENKIVPAIGTMEIKAVKPIHLKKILNSCEGLSASYITKIKNVVHEVFEAAKENRLILSNPADGLKIPNTKPKGERRSITDYEREHILNVATTHRAGLFIEIMLYCGLRPSEVAALRWKDINLENKIINVSAAIKRDGTIGAPKSKAGFRQIPIPNVLLIDLKQGNPFSFVCTQVCGNKHTPTSIKQMWSSFKYNLNINMGCKTFKGGLIPPYRVVDDLTLYCLRHTFCTDLQDAGVPINVARELMGHSDISTTSKIYTHKSEKSFNSAAELINKFHSPQEQEKVN